MEFLRLLESIRIPGLNELMLAITYLGDEIAFLVVALVLFWCVDKRRGYFIMSVGFIGTIISQFMKLWFRIPRPWVQDPDFSILEQARKGAGGYSFPSGHSQSSVGTFGAMAVTEKKSWLKWVCIAVCLLVPFSRMYVGVHTPLDVTVGALIAVVLIVALRPVFYKKDGKYIPWLIGFMTVLAVAYLCYVEFFPFPADVDSYNLESGTKNAYTLLGCLLGLIVAYSVDQKWVHFDVKAVWWAQILKVLGGLVVVLAIKEGLSSLLTSLCGYYAGRLIRYFLIVVVAGCVWPMTFRFFGKLGIKV